MDRYVSAKLIFGRLRMTDVTRRLSPHITKNACSTISIMRDVIALMSATI
jgi:hypothetical protein